MLPAIDWSMQLVDPATGRATPDFQRFWQNLSIEASAGAAAIPSIANKVDKGTSTGWVSPTGTAAKTGFATYTAPTISTPPTQAEVQALADHVQALSRHLAAAILGLKTSQTFAG